MFMDLSRFEPVNWSLGVPFHFWSALIFWLGCMVSFLNVHPPDAAWSSVVSPPSHCPLQIFIPWYLNACRCWTWLMLRARCKNCDAPDLHPLLSWSCRRRDVLRSVDCLAGNRRPGRQRYLPSPGSSAATFVISISSQINHHRRYVVDFTCCR